MGGCGSARWISTLQVVSISEMALRLRLAVAITSSCWAELPAATALAVAVVMPFVMRMNSSGVVVLSGVSLDWNTWDGGHRQTHVIGQKAWQEAQMFQPQCFLHDEAQTRERK